MSSRFTDNFSLSNQYSNFNTKTKSKKQSALDKDIALYQDTWDEEERKKRLAKKKNEDFSNINTDKFNIAKQLGVKAYQDSKKAAAQEDKYISGLNTDQFNIAKNLAAKPTNNIPAKSVFNSPAQSYKQYTGQDLAKTNAVSKYTNNEFINKYEQVNNTKVDSLKKKQLLNMDSETRKSIENDLDKNIALKKKSEGIFGKGNNNILGISLDNSPTAMKARLMNEKIGNIAAKESLGEEPDKSYINKLNTGNKVIDTATNFIGQTAGYFAPGMALDNTFKLGGKIANKLLPNATSTVAKVGKSAITGGIGQGLIAAYQNEAKKSQGEKMSFGQQATNVAKNVAGGAAFMGGLHGLGELGGAIGKKIFSRGTNGISLSNLEPELKLESNIPKNGFRDRTALEWHNKAHEDYKLAEQNWENAVNEVQNRFKQKELTVPEEQIVKNEMGIDLPKLADEYDKAYNKYLSAQQGLSKNIERNMSKTDTFNQKYGLNEDISKLSDTQKNDVYKSKTLNILEDSGKSISSRLKTDNPYDVVKFYEKKYDFKQPIQVVKSESNNTNPAKIIIGKDKNGIINNVKLELNDKYTRNQQIGAMRHEIEHYKDVQEGHITTESINQNVKGNTVAEMMDNAYKGHHKNYNVFDREYLINSSKKENPSNVINGNTESIKVGESSNQNQYNLDFMNNNSNSQSIPKPSKVKSDWISPSQHMTDVKSNKFDVKKIKAFGTTLQRLFTNRNVDVGKVSKHAEDLLNVQNQANGTVDYILNNKLVDKVGNSLTDHSFKDVVTMKNNKLQSAYEDYLLNKHNIDRVREGKKLLVDQEGHQIDSEQSKNIIKHYDEIYPEFKNLSEKYTKNWNEFSNEWLTDFVNKDTLSKLQEKYKSYVPSYRQDESFSQPINANRIVNGAKIKAATGSSKKILPLNEQIAGQVSKIVKAQRKNEVYKEMLKPVLENPEKYKNQLEIVKIGADNAKYANATEREIAQQVASLQNNTIPGENQIDSLVDLISDPIKQVQGKDGYLTVFDKGTPITLKIKDKNLFEALNASNKSGKFEALDKAWSKVVTTPFKGAVTTYNPFFATRNVARDLPSAYIQGSVDNPLEFIKGEVESVYKILRDDPVYQRYKAVGGTATNINEKALSPSVANKSVTNKLFHKTIDTLGFVNEISEQMSRFNEFKSVLEKTGDVHKARIAAADVTVNFSRGGNFTKAVDKIFPYTNAAVQGVSKATRSIIGGAAKGNFKPLAKAVTATSAPSAALMYYNYSNPDRKKIYDNIPQDIKNTNYIIVAGKDNIIKIPKTKEVGLFLGSLGERIYDYVAKGDKKAFDNLGKTIYDSVMPVNTKSGLFVPAYNIALGGNKDYFGREIVPKSLQGMSPKNQYDEKSTDLSKLLGKVLNKSPKQIDYLMDSYTGIVYDIIKKSGQSKSPLQDMAKANFTVDTSTYNRTTAGYYDLVNKIKTEKADFDKSVASKKSGIDMKTKRGKAEFYYLLSPKQQEKYDKYKDLNKSINEQSQNLKDLRNAKDNKEYNNQIKSYISDLKAN